MKDLLKKIRGCFKNSNKTKQPEINHLDKLKQFGFQKLNEFNAEDVFIIGYPKSGNTLLQHLVAHLVFGLRNDAPKSLINSCVTEYYNNPMFFRHEKCHFFKSHELPNEKFKNVIYILRDGREAVRSYHYMLTNMQKESSLETLYLNGGKTFVGTWEAHLTQWVENKYGANILFVRYEDLIRNKFDEVKRICQFLNLERSNSEIEDVLDATSFENMKLMEEGYNWKRQKSFQPWNKMGKFVREGNTQGFKKDDLIDEIWVRKFEKLSEKMLRRFKYIE